MGWVNPKTNEIVAYHRGVRPALAEAQTRGVAAAKGFLAEHDHPGGVSIKKSKGKLDRYVVMEDDDSGRGEPAAAAIEYGHTTSEGRPVEGLHILGRTLGSI